MLTFASSAVNYHRAIIKRPFSFSEFRECFDLYARSGHITTLDELTVVMRSLGVSPTVNELKTYLKDKGNFYFQYNRRMFLHLFCVLNIN